MMLIQFFRAVRLCFLLAVLRSRATALADVPRTITAYVNETTILPCSITVVGDLPTVEWSKEGISPNITMLYRNGCETFDEKNPEFHDRTNLVLNKLKNGNLSQIIHNLRLSDNGTYQCRTLREKQWKVESTVELVVVAVSEPKLTFVPDTDGVSVQCKAECWFPKPSLQFLDDQGNEIEAVNPKNEETHPECYTFTRKAALPAATNRVKCRVSQLNVIRETEIFLPDDWVRFCSTSTTIYVSVTFVLTSLLWICGIVCYKKCRPYGKSEASFFKSKNTPASKSGQSVRGSRSSLNGSKHGNQLPQCNTQNPATSSTSNHPEPDDKSEVKESKPAISKQNLTPDPQEKPDRPKSMSAPMTNDGASPGGTKHHHSSSCSSRSGSVRSPRRLTMSNQYNIFQGKDAESQSLIEGNPEQ